jgi:hypothetical protein
MKRSTFLLLTLLFFHQGYSQDTPRSDPQIDLKWAPAGLFAGNISLLGEYTFRKKTSLTVKIGLPITKTYSSKFDGKNTDINMRTISFLTGYRVYLSKKELKGFYIEPYFKYVHSTSYGWGESTLDNQPVTMDFNNNYNAAGIGVQLGTQFLIAKKWIIDFFFLGPELNYADNNFMASDATNSSSWNTIQADQAENDIHQFLHQFPFIGNKTTVHVDTNDKTITADFNGLLAGIRAGVAVGFAF